MSPHPKPEELEALARGELEPAQAVGLEAHLQDCATCRQDLAWVRAERALFVRRHLKPLPPELWQGIETRLVAGPPPVAGRASARRRFGILTMSWLNVAAAAAVMIVTLSLGGAYAVRGLRSAFHVLFASSPSREPDAPEPPSVVRTALKVKGPVKLHLSTAAADISAVAGAADEVRVQVTDSDTTAVELHGEGEGELRLVFALRNQPMHELESGHVHIELPPGSLLEASTASGAVTVTGVGGDVQVQTASGDVSLVEVKKVQVSTASGDLSLQHFTGPAQISTVSGDIKLLAAGAPLGSVECSSTSGEIHIEGRCAAGCAVKAHSVSGDVALHTDAQSGYVLHFSSQSGELSTPQNERAATDKRPPPEDKEDKEDKEDNDGDETAWHHEKTLRVGSSAGSIDVTTVSGNGQVVRSANP